MALTFVLGGHQFGFNVPAVNWGRSRDLVDPTGDVEVCPSSLLERARKRRVPGSPVAKLSDVLDCAIDPASSIIENRMLVDSRQGGAHSRELHVIDTAVFQNTASYDYFAPYLLPQSVGPASSMLRSLEIVRDVSCSEGAEPVDEIIAVIVKACFKEPVKDGKKTIMLSRQFRDEIMITSDGAVLTREGGNPGEFGYKERHQVPVEPHEIQQFISGLADVARHAANGKYPQVCVDLNPDDTELAWVDYRRGLALGFGACRPCIGL
jgi:hypothetical protein